MRNYNNGKIYKITFQKGDKTIIYLDYTTQTIYERYHTLKHYYKHKLLDSKDFVIDLIENTTNRDDLKTKFKYYVDLYLKNKDNNTIIYYNQHKGYERERKIVDQVIKCECGSIIKYNSKPSHVKNLKHINYINNKCQILSNSFIVVF